MSITIITVLLINTSLLSYNNTVFSDAAVKCLEISVDKFKGAHIYNFPQKGPPHWLMTPMMVIL